MHSNDSGKQVRSTNFGSFHHRSSHKSDPPPRSTFPSQPTNTTTLKDVNLHQEVLPESLFPPGPMLPAPVFQQVPSDKLFNPPQPVNEQSHNKYLSKPFVSLGNGPEQYFNEETMKPEPMEFPTYPPLDADAAVEMHVSVSYCAASDD